MIKIILCSDFFDSFVKLPLSVQNKVKYFFEKFSENNLINGFNYEAINKVNGKQLYSARIDITYRIIIYEEKKESKFYVLWVDHHDEAYKWAKNRREINIAEANIVIANRSEYIKKGLHTEKGNNLFSRISSKDLIKLGVPLLEMERIRSIPDIKTLECYKELFEPEVYNNLEWIANDFHVRDILEYNKIKKEEVLLYIKEKVINPALNSEKLAQEIKDSVKNTYLRLELKKTTKEIIDFFDDALLSNRGSHIHSEFVKNGLIGFEEIKDDIHKLAIMSGGV